MESRWWLLGVAMIALVTTGVAVVALLGRGPAATRYSDEYLSVELPEGYTDETRTRPTDFGRQSTFVDGDSQLAIEWSPDVLAQYELDIGEIAERTADKLNTESNQTKVGDRSVWLVESTTSPTSSAYYAIDNLAVAVTLDSTEPGDHERVLKTVIGSLTFTDLAFAPSEPVVVPTRSAVRVKLPVDCAGRDQSFFTITAIGKANVRDRASPDASVVSQVADGTTVIGTGATISNGGYTWHEIYVPGTERCVWAADIILAPVD